MSDRVAELLLKAIRQLSQVERDEVLAGFLAGRVAGTRLACRPRAGPVRPDTPRVP